MLNPKKNKRLLRKNSQSQANTDCSSNFLMPLFIYGKPGDTHRTS